MRGGVTPTPSELAILTGLEFSMALCEERLRYKSCSIWAGAGETRTPLHVDWVHAVIYQIAGKKDILLAHESAVEEAVEAGDLPEGVLTEGNTDNSAHLVGSLEEVYGVDASGWSTKVVRGRVVTLEPGDSLLLPAGTKPPPRHQGPYSP